MPFPRPRAAPRDVVNRTTCAICWRPRCRRKASRRLVGAGMGRLLPVVVVIIVVALLRPAAAAAAVVVHAFGDSSAEVLAAKEMRRYWGLLSGTRPGLLLHRPGAGGDELSKLQTQLLLARRRQQQEEDGGAAEQVILIATRGHPVLRGLGDNAFDAAVGSLSGSESHLVHSLSRPSMRSSERQVLICTGASAQATLYAVYSAIETLGARFFLHGDILPPPNPSLTIPAVSTTFSPKFATRGLQPFHDFPMGPDFWQPEFWKALATNMQKMKLNFW